ncbi:NAD(P)-binding protein [Aspergillus ellipticus CBS 707.79]|uniref:NAD(P)-binding protein n=1 Tax=Aspergillus ellipticus CBS 707.79 TaxID=1448320 RepID=A0A319CU53_9EURO|nr:NAD(P)-binding protein [Aspergillus ellipticus CBS 707.79]
MADRITTVLIIGATSGIGEAFARRFHAAGKQVIITGRRAERLQQLSQELPGLDTRAWDITDSATLSTHVADILASHPTLDTVFVNAGIQRSFSMLDSSISTPESITSEIQANLTAPILISRAFLPHLLARASAGHPANLLITSSSIGYFPLPFYPVYCATKAAIHAFLVSLRAQVGFAAPDIQRNLSVVEVVPPYTDTGLDAAHRARIMAMQGGPDKAFAPMPLDEYIDAALPRILTPGPDGKLPKEVGVGFGQVGVDAWRGAFGPGLEGMGLNC